MYHMCIRSLRVHALFRFGLACFLGSSALAGAGGKEPSLPVDLPSTHINESGTVRFRTPPNWQVTTRAGQPDVLEARGDGLLVRILRRDGELGLDSLHVECMLVRLAPETQSAPQVDYEYDFVGGSLGERRVLDSAFVVHYDAPIEGARDWRQRNVTLVGGGESVCVIGYTPQPTWKKSKEARRLFDAVLGSVEFRPWR
jgi:hypothetical protein